MAKRIWIGVSGVAALLVGAALAALFGWRTLQAPLPIPPEGAWLDVPAGTSFWGVTAELGRRELLEHGWVLKLYARATGDATRIRAGEYQLTPGLTPITLVQKLVTGQVFLHQITIVEGSRFADVLSSLRSNPAIRATALDAAAIMAELGEPGVAPEGQFFPDTYFFPRGTTDLDLLKMAHAAMRDRLARAWEARSPDIALKSPYEALILASIIEKETALPTERKLISAVFQQRLRRGMRLQTDPTVIYGLGDAFDGNLRRIDLDRDTPYNTYTRGGLPPTPIALPGGASLEAAVQPAETDALYFVATGRGDGSHYFSATLEEHEQAVRKYLHALRGEGP